MAPRGAPLTVLQPYLLQEYLPIWPLQCNGFVALNSTRWHNRSTVSGSFGMRDGFHLDELVINITLRQHLGDPDQ